MHFPGGSDGKASAYNAGDPGLISGSGRCPGEGNGNPLQYSCLENPVDGGAWQADVPEVTKSRTRLSNVTFTFKPQLKTFIQGLLDAFCILGTEERGRWKEVKWQDFDFIDLFVDYETIWNEHTV